MFTGIIEALGTIVAVENQGSNRHFTVASPFAAELKIDQSVAHDGVCLTVVAVDPAAGTHVATATCLSVTDQQGSWLFRFGHAPGPGRLTVEKGSICVNGTSLTCFESTEDGFTVAIIPFTYEHTSFQQLRAGETVNLEFDIVGKYVAKLLGRAG